MPLVMHKTVLLLWWLVAREACGVAVCMGMNTRMMVWPLSRIDGSAWACH